MLIDFELFYTYKEDELLFELSSNFSYQNMSKSDMEHELKGMLNGIVAEVDNSKKVLGIIGEFFNNYQLFYMELFDYKRICIQIKENFEYLQLIELFGKMYKVFYILNCILKLFELISEENFYCYNKADMHFKKIQWIKFLILLSDEKNNIIGGDFYKYKDKISKNTDSVFDENFFGRVKNGLNKKVLNISEDSINKPDFNWLSNITLSAKELKNFEEKTGLNIDCFKEIPDHIKDRFMNIHREEYELLNMENMLTIDIKNAVYTVEKVKIIKTFDLSDFDENGNTKIKDEITKKEIEFNIKDGKVTTENPHIEKFLMSNQKLKKEIELLGKQGYFSKELYVKQLNN